MATSGEPTAKQDSGGAEQVRSSPPSLSPQEHQESESSSPNSSSKSSSCCSSLPSSARITARETSSDTGVAAAAAADARPTHSSIDRDTTAPTLQDGQQQQLESYDRRCSTPLSYFAPIGAGRLTFVPPAGVRSQTNLRIQPLSQPISRETVLRYYTPSGERATAATQSCPQQRQESGGGLVYFNPSPTSYGPAAAISTSGSTRSPLSTSLASRRPGQPPILPAAFVQSVPYFENYIPQQQQQRLLASSGGPVGAAPASFWGTQHQQGFLAASKGGGGGGGIAAANSQPVQKEQYQQTVQVERQRKEGGTTETPATVLVGTPRQPQYYMEPRVLYTDMKSQQPFYAAAAAAVAPRPVNEEKTWTTASPTVRQGMEGVPLSTRMQQAMPRQIPRDIFARDGQWGEQIPVLRVARGLSRGETKRRRGMPWDCYQELRSPRDLLPMLSDSQARFSRSLRANGQDFLRAFQRLHAALCRYYEKVTRNIGIDGPSCGGPWTPDDAQQQQQRRTSGSRSWRRMVGDNYAITGYVDEPSLIYQHQLPSGGQAAADLKKGREATQLMWKDGRIVYTDSNATPEMILRRTTDQKTAEGLDGTGQLQFPPGKSPRDGTYYISAATTPSTRACPTCGASQVLVYVDEKAPYEEEGSPNSSESALQRLAHGDVDGCLQRLGEWRCTLCSDVAGAADDELLHTGGVVQQGGEWVDQMVELLIRGVADTMRSLLLMVPRPSQQIVEGYPLYEPDYTYLTRKGRPTSLTGNFCIDQLNAFLDACLVDDGDVSAVLPKAPPVPDTTRTGLWLIDAVNAALDRLFPPLPPPPQPSSRPFCPPVETLIPPCCRGTPLLPPRPPPQPATVCPCMDICTPTAAVPGQECPHCHQPLRNGICPVESPRESRLKKLLVECFSSSNKGSMERQQSPPRAYAYDAPPVGYYVPSSAKQPQPEYYAAPVYGGGPPTATVGKQTNERIYYTPAAAMANIHGKPSNWAEPFRVVSSSGRADTADVCQYPYAPVCATQPCSKGFTVPTGEGVFIQPRAQ